MKYRLIAYLLLVACAMQGQNEFKVIWEQPKQFDFGEAIWFENGVLQGENLHLATYCGELFYGADGTLVLKNPQFQPLTQAEADIIRQSNITFDTEIDIKQHAEINNGFVIFSFCFIPVRTNPESHEIEKLVSFQLEVEENNQADITSKTTKVNADTNALAQGNWYKLAVAQTGVYKITPQFLANCGFSVTNLPSSSIRVLGNGQGMLPEANDKNSNPGLQEVALFVEDGGDGVFNGNDYALFYAVGPHTWKYNEGENGYAHTYNVYSDLSHYFITVDNGIGKRINPVGYSPTTANYVVTSFDDFNFIEEDKYNLVASGRKWFGDLFDFQLTHDYTLQFQNVDINDTAYLRSHAAARSVVSNTKMEYRVDNTLVSDYSFSSILNSSSYVSDSGERVYFTPNGNTFNISVTYNNSSNSSATAWLDYFSIELRRLLQMQGSSVIFRDKRAYKKGGAAEFRIGNATSGLQIWDVTDHTNARNVPFALNGGQASFKAPSDSLRTFVAISGSSFPLPSQVGSVPNQHLMGLRDVDMIILAHHNFLPQANTLAEFHRNHDGISVYVATPEQVYNEFSSGMQDITAIRLFMRNLYKKSSNNPVKYLLLFGDASYDYKNRVPNMHNFVPIYQSTSSYSLNFSTCTDDFYGYLDDNEGYNMLQESLDLAIGRMPVKTPAEADIAVNKVINYVSNPSSFGDWRNRTLLISDDVDDAWELDFVEYTDRLAEKLDTTVPYLNIQKVYIDSYTQEVKAGSQRYPDARQDIFRKVEKGNLVTSYLGHGGEVGWAKERILQLSDINGWKNLNSMPLFLTVTCEFTRIDDPARVSAGEQLFLNEEGGAVALMSTLRPVYATTPTYNLNRDIFDFLFYNNNGEYLTLGEVIQATKNVNNSNDRLRFALVGDPAMKLAIPTRKVLTDSINGQEAGSFSDTLKALSKVKISGHIENANGALISNFNGKIYPTVYDKKAQKSTLKNDGKGSVFKYKSRENVIFRGNSTVENGYFSFEFIVPLDINFVIESGKISYYATNDIVDANGYNTDVLIGGLDLSAGLDDVGPEVNVFINDTNFLNGGLTDKDPLSLALIADSSGINTVGNGIGHDIIGILDGNTGKPYILNDYFQSDLNSYQSGEVRFPFFDLAPGTHTLLIRAWDVNNNPGEGQITFIVDASHQLALKRVLNYPNPFHTETRFQFEHNRAGEPLEVDIQIFNQQGAMVKRITENLISLGNRVNQITWDGTGNNGQMLGSGVYVYRVVVKSTEDGSTTEDYSKLVYVN